MSLQINTFIHKLSRGLHWAGVYISIPVLILILSVDVTLRYIFNSPLIWGSEVSALILSIVFFASLPQVTGMQGHIRMDMLYRLMSPKMKGITDAATGLCGAVFALLLAWGRLAKKTIDSISALTSLPQISGELKI